ncbi:hypothetical protein Q8A73_014812 [Channa argus]|nr:hypothetical protein Q8A73_014812 [Channa argus]
MGKNGRQERSPLLGSDCSPALFYNLSLSPFHHDVVFGITLKSKCSSSRELVTTATSSEAGGQPRRSAAIHVCDSPASLCQRCPAETAASITKVHEEVVTSTHKSANKSTVMAERVVSTACPQITKTHGARQKNPSVVRVVLQQIARVVTHISSRSKQCETISVGEEQSVGAKGCEEQEGEEEVSGWGTRDCLLTAPLERGANHQQGAETH